MIDKLTPEQEAKLDVYRDKWLKIGLSTEPCNFEESKKYAKLAYEAAELTPPAEFMLTDSPLDCNKKLAEIGLDGDYAYCFGCHDASWLAFYDFFHTECGVDLSILNGLWGLAKYCGWWVPFEKLCVFQHRPCEIHMNDRGLLHREDGPTVLYRDGFSVWSINGVRVDEQIVMRPETMTVKQIEGEDNAERKRVMIERFGVSRYLSESEAKLLDADHEGARQGAAARCLIETSQGEKWLYGTDGSTKRGYYIPVPNEAKTCQEAHNLIAGFNESNIVSKS